LAGQLARPVEFVRQIENMALTGVRTFLEVGPGSVLTRLAEATLKARPDLADWDCIALDASAGKKPGLLDLAQALARLAARGHAVDLTAWEAGQTYPVRLAKPGLTVPIVGANYVRPKPARAVPFVNGKPPAATGTASTPLSSAPPIPPPAPVNSPPRTLMTDPASNPPAPDQTGLASALGVTQQSLMAFQRMHDETARLHKQFLDNQQAALATLQALIAQQQALLTGQPLPAYLPPPMPAYASPAPAPVVAPAPMVATPAPTPPPAAKASPVALVPPARASAPSRDSSAILLAVVAQKTGYPADMLGLDMALDADLGIDSIKRVEILSALQEKIPDAPAVKPEHLGTLHTLRDIVNFLGAPAEPATPKVNGLLREPMSAPGVNGPPSPAPGNGQDVAGTLLSVVAEKTGYPADMLGLDMALDADLGIDSIKRVEILSALQEKIPDAPAVRPEHLGTLHTLRDIASFLGGSASRAGPPIAPTVEDPRPFDQALTPGSAEGERASAASPPATVVRSVVRPVPIDVSLARPRVAFAKHAPVWLIAERSDFTARVSQQFDAAGCRAQVISWTDAPVSYDPAGLAGLVLIAPGNHVPDDLPLRALRWLRRAAPALTGSADAARAFFATVSQLDGAFGFGTLAPTRSPVQGALAGLSKTAAREWPGVHCKAVDVDPGALDRVSDILVEEILTAGPVEVGLSANERVALEMEEAPAVLPAGRSEVLQPGDVIVVTGGARGVTAEALFPLVRACRPKLVLLGRTPVTITEPEWLAPLEDEARIKQAIIARSDKPVTPREIGEQCKRLLAQREVRRNLKRLRDAGAIVEYIPADVQDAGALAAVVAGVRKRLGPVAALVHGAGVLADRKIENLSDAQFQHVYSTKVAGLQNLLAATADDSLKAIVLFSSSTGRFGRTGQAAYAAANEVLNKTAQRLARVRPGCRTVAVNWGPWEGGMVTPALARVFAKEGIGLIPYAEGGETLLREVASADRAAEIVVLARPRTAVEPPSAAIPAANILGVVFERPVSVADHPVLRSHVIGDKAVVPFVLHLEWMAHAAMHGNPGLKFHGFDDLRVFQGIHVEEATPTDLRVLSGRATKKDSLFVVPVEIRGTRKGREVTHSRAEIVLADRLPDAPAPVDPPATAPFPYSLDEIYDEFLFHGPDLQAFDRVDGMADAGALAFARTAPPPATWMDAPVRTAWLGDPLAVDAAFQLLSVWSGHRHRAASLPCFAGRYRQFRRTFPPKGVSIAVRITHDSGSTARADIEFIDADGRLVAQMTDAEHVIDAALNDAFRRGRLASSRQRALVARVGG
jgi:NADP-dependent 3-hydroxy acid dehydrogenase YdfG/acyl carrier protein